MHEKPLSEKMNGFAVDAFLVGAASVGYCLTSIILMAVMDMTIYEIVNGVAPEHIAFIVDITAFCSGPTGVISLGVAAASKGFSYPVRSVEKFLNKPSQP